ncbi:MAG TPA: hypothetical protein VGT40_03075 [Methylomirabilota bacterium]|jgi:hypothetical protein|nr:hypothetical protein [Methylomirabilota bacterium]
MSQAIAKAVTQWTGLLVVAIAVLALSPPGIASADDCVALGGAIVAGECQISTNVGNKAGTFNLDETLHLLTGALITVSPPATGITINITGDFIMDAGSKISGDNNINPGHGADIVINATENISLAGGAPGAIITSNLAGTCTSGSRGGNITLNADSDHDLSGNFTQDNGSEITSIAGCGRGEIIITGVTINVDGLVLSQGTTTLGRGGPITVDARCNLNVSDTGEIVSLGRDPGADLVHLEGGCNVNIFGLVASTGPGHTFPPPPNRCDSAFRPDKPNNATACVEIWAGDSLVIDHIGPHQGMVHADTGNAGGTQGMGWIDIFARGDITVNGLGPAFVTCPLTPPEFNPSKSCFAVHANQTLSGGHGGLIHVASVTGSVIANGQDFQANDTNSGGAGGRPAAVGLCTITPCGGITVEAFSDVNLTNGISEAKGNPKPAPGTQHGGQIDVRAFNGAILANASSLLDVTGRVPPDGVVNLTACGAIEFPPGVVTPVAPTKNTPVCGGAPVLPSYVVLPPCECGGCPCVSTFSFLAGQPPIVRINGTDLKAVTEVRLSTADCNPTAGTVVPFVPPKTNAQLKVDVTGIPTGDYHIITISGGGSCCTANTVHVP